MILIVNIFFERLEAAFGSGVTKKMTSLVSAYFGNVDWAS